MDGHAWHFCGPPDRSTLADLLAFDLACAGSGSAQADPGAGRKAGVGGPRRIDEPLRLLPEVPLAPLGVRRQAAQARPNRSM